VREASRVLRRAAPCFAAALLVSGSADVPASPREWDARPNLLLVVVDDLRWDDIGAAGHPFVRTPHIDRLAREGVRFLNAFATTPLCSPSRASILTGLYAHRHGILDNTDHSAASHALPTFPRRLRAAGYETAFIGKWHMGNDETPRPGFDFWVSMKGQGEAVDPVLHEDGRSASVPGYVTDILTERALSFLARPRQRPFFLMLAHKALHPNVLQRDDGSTADIGEGGFIPAPRHRELYAREALSRRPNYAVPPRGKPALERRLGQLPPLGPGTATDDETIRDRLRMLAGVDEGLGRILDALEKAGTLDETVIAFTSDNGYFYGEHGLSEERRLAYEESIRLPLLVRYPKLARAGSTPGAMALAIDLAPTLLDLAGATPDQPLDGRSLLPLLRGEPGPWRTSILVEYFSDTVFPRIQRMGYQAVRTDRYKYVRYRELDGMDELYDLATDPYELRNLMGSSEHAALLGELREELERLLAASGAADLAR
jgi:N-acetylglucosamine-6-sulfatase